MAEVEELLATVAALREAAVRIPAGASGRAELLDVVERVAASLTLNAEALPSRTSAVVRQGQSAAEMANDFNNVLMTILGNAEVAMAGLPEGSRARTHLQEIAHAAQRGAHLTRQMLATLRGSVPGVGPADLEEVARGLVGLIRSSLPATAVVELALACDLPRLELDAGQIAVGLQRLVNAVVGSLDLERGRVTLSSGVVACEREDLERSWVEGDLSAGRYAFLELALSVPGRMISPVDLLSPNGASAHWRDSEVLAPLLEAAWSHRGTVAVQSRADGALAVRLLLPAMSGNGLSSPGNREGASSALVLLVDDDPQVRAVASKMLEMQGVRVLTAADGAAGVELFRRHAAEIELVVLDLAMPVMDGEKAFWEMVRVRPDVRVVLSTGYDEARASERLAGANLAGFIQKPYRLASLREVVRGLLDGS